MYTLLLERYKNGLRLNNDLVQHLLYEIRDPKQGGKKGSMTNEAIELFVNGISVVFSNGDIFVINE